MKNILFIFGLIFVINLPVSGTIQMPDKIIYNGKEYPLRGKSLLDSYYPMEDYFKKYPDKRPKVDGVATYLWRKYVATYEIKDNQLYLKDIGILVDGFETKSVLNEIFQSQELIKIDWLTGLLAIPDGKSNGYGDHERYIILEIIEGNFLREKQIILDIDENFMNEDQYGKYTEYELFKKRQFEAFKKTDEYYKAKTRIKDRRQDASNKFCDELIETDILKYSSKILVE